MRNRDGTRLLHSLLCPTLGALAMMAQPKILSCLSAQSEQSQSKPTGHVCCHGGAVQKSFKFPCWESTVTPADEMEGYGNTMWVHPNINGARQVVARKQMVALDRGDC